MLLREANRIASIAGLGDDVVSLSLEERPNALTNDFMVVGEENSRTDRSLRGRGRRAPENYGGHPRFPV